MKIEVDLPDYLFGSQDEDDSHGIGPAIVAKAAEMLIGKINNSTTSYELGREVTERVRSIRDEEIRSRIEPLLAEALTAALQPTDTWGAPKGPPITLTEHIVTIATEYLTKETGEYGRPRKSVVRKFISEEVDRQFQGELRKAVDEAKAEVLAAVKDNAAQVIADTIARMGGVR